MSFSKSDMRQISKSLTAGMQAGRDSDPAFYQALNVLPNPDVILRKAGKSESVFDAIQSDAHVIGELRAVRAGLLKYESRMVAGEDTSKGKQAVELCKQWLARRPAPGMTWPDVIWNMGTATFRGFRVHELVWERNGKLILPTSIVDRPNRRFRFDRDNQLRILTREQPANGIQADDFRFLVSRHMPSNENPYGQALFSSCFWPYTFKHGGFRFFVKLCERFGLPFPIGKYPAGTPEEEQNALAEALEEMIEAGYAIFQEGGSVTLLESNSSGNGSPVQQLLIHECNREMSKALTSQTLATEQNKTGARAAAETAHKRESGVHKCDRDIIAFTFDEAFRWITQINLGDNVEPPTFEFYEEKKGSKERAEVYQIAASISPKVSLAGMHKELNIPMADTDQDAIPQTKSKTEFAQASDACQHCGGFHFNQADDGVLEQADHHIEQNVLNPIAQMLAEFEDQGKSLKEFQRALVGVYPNLDDAALSKMTADALTLEWLKGSDDAER